MSILSVCNNQDKSEIFIGQLESEAVNFTDEGEFYLENGCKRLLNQVFPCLENSRLTNIADVYCKALDDLEKMKVMFETSKEGDETLRDSKKYARVIRVGNIIHEKLAGRSSYEPVKKSMHDLQRRLVALKYRCEFLSPTKNEVEDKNNAHKDNSNADEEKSNAKVEIGEKIDKEKEYKNKRAGPEVERNIKIESHGSASVDILEQLAEAWKKTEIYANASPGLSDLDKERLNEVRRYPKFLELLLSDVNLQKRFFTWSMRNHNGVRAFIEFPATVQKVRETFMSSRFGASDGDGLAVYGHEQEEKAEKSEKDGASAAIRTVDIKIKYEAADKSIQTVSLLDEAEEISLRNNFKLTVGKVFEIISQKATDWGDIEFCNGILCNWHVGKMGRWNPEKADYDLVKDLVDLPVCKILTLDQAKVLWGKDKDGYDYADGRNSIGRNMATRRTETLDAHGTHAYRMIAIPKQDNKKNIYYTAYTFGKFPTTFPKEWLSGSNVISRTIYKIIEYIKYFFQTQPGTIAYPDTSIYNTERQHGGTTFRMSPEESDTEIRMIQRDIKLAREGKAAYNINCHNCAIWGLEWRSRLGEERVPEDQHKATILHAEPQGLGGYLFEIIKMMSDSVREVFFNCIAWMADGYRSHIGTNDGIEIEVSITNPKICPWKKVEINPSAQGDRRLALNPYMIPAYDLRKEVFNQPGWQR